MFIEDEELRNIFQVTSEEHLQRLDEGLLDLEKHPTDQTRLEALLREAHSLKGDANMLGVKDVGALAHQIEDVFGALKRGEIAFAAELSDRLYHALETIQKLVNEAVTGEPAEVNTVHVMAYLMGAPMIPLPDPVPRNELAKELEILGTQEEPIHPELIDLAATDLTQAEQLNGVAEQNGKPETAAIPQLVSTVGLAEPAPALFSAIPQTQNGTAQTTYRIDTIRVETPKLDALMTQAGELTVIRTRIDRRLVDIEDAIALWEEWSRETLKPQFAIHGIKQGLQAEQLGQLQSYSQLNQDRLEQMGKLLNRLRLAAYEDTTRLETVTTDLEDGIRTLRLLPLSTIFQFFPRTVRDLSRQQGKSVELVIEGGETRVDKRILEEMKDPLLHMIRNAIDHGIETPEERQQQGKPETATIFLRGYQTATNIVIEVADDGRGLDTNTIKQIAVQRGICRLEDLASMTDSQIHALIFAPGFSTRTFITEISGRGVGLDVVRTNVERLKGNIQVESQPGTGTTFRVQLRTTLATAHVLLILVEGVAYALPVEFVEIALLVKQTEIFLIEGQNTILLEEQPISIVRLAHLLELEAISPMSNTSQPCIVIKVGEERLGLLVDALMDEQDVVLKPQSKLLQRVRNISGATILGTGEVCMVLNPQDLIKSMRRKAGAIASPLSISSTLQNSVHSSNGKQSVLLVEDSITIRTQEKRILEGAGYEVTTAVDGLDALSKLQSRMFDAVVSDVQMPNLDGLSLAAKIRQHKEFNELPIILVTSLASDEDKRRGAEAGASAYITKGAFDQAVLLDTLKRLV